MEENKTKKGNFLLKIGIVLSILVAISFVTNGKILGDGGVVLAAQDHCYLSDFPYDSPKLPETDKSHVGWKTITMDSNLETQYNKGLITLMVNGQAKSFLKGISAHANSEVIFDVSEYVEKGFTKFSTYYGVDASRGSNGNAVYFKITTKTEANVPWQAELGQTGDMKGNSEAGFIEIDLTGKKFIKLEAYGRGGVTSAHACYGDAKLYKEGYTESNTQAKFIKTVDEYDRILKEQFNTNKFNITGDYELTLLQRDLVNAIGYDLLQSYVSLSEDNLQIVEWLMTDINNLKPYMMGGKPESGKYFKSFEILSRLYKERGEDLKDTTQITTNRGTSTLADMYKTMMLAISLTHCDNVYLWINGGNYSDPVERYDIYKKLYHGKVVADETTTKGIGSDLIEKTKFASLHVEEMRWVMNTIIDNEEIEWLNWFAREKKNGATGPYSYINYTFGYNYNKAIYYDQAQYDKWNQKYNLRKYNITYQQGNPKLWIVFEEGSVCGGLSKTGSCVWGSFKGLPNTCVSQPGHCAYIYYNQDANGNGIWGLGNDVGGWHQAGRTEHLNSRMPLEWGNQAYIDFNKDWLGMATYVLLSQGALNQYDNFVKSEEILMLADVYKDDVKTRYQIYDKALEALPINIDAWYEKIKAYRTDKTKTDKDYYEIAEGIFNNLKLYPLPMYHLAREVQKDLTKPEYQFKFTLDQTKTLTYAKDHANESIQSAAVRQEATHLLGQTDSKLATFSFDGENAESIKLGQRFSGSDVGWDFCLNGKVSDKNSWIQAKDAYGAGAHVQKLTKDQINAITAENDIYVHIIGVDYSENNLYKIDITEQSLPSNLYANDLENRIIGVNLRTEWRYTENDAWTSYSVASPDLTGDKTVQIRQAATGTKLTSAPSPIYTFTQDNQPDTRKYIPVSHLSIHAVSSQATNNNGAATYAIDANYNTRWHSAWNGTDTERCITIKLDNPVALSAVEFVPAGGGNGKILDGTIYGSMDGKNWEKLSDHKNIRYPNRTDTIEQAIQNTQKFEIAEPKEVQYVKIVADNASQGNNMARNGNWFTARAFNLYQDLTKKPISKVPTASIAYSTTKPTKDTVIARLVNPSTPITITNNNGNDSYVFTENGSFTFDFEDANGNKGSSTATVNWIDKDGPTADVEYRLGDDKKLIAILDNISEDVYLLNENNKKTNYIEVENGKVVSISYLDDSENEYKVAELDENKVTKKITYKNTTGVASDKVKYYVTIPNGVNENGEEIFEEQYLDEHNTPVTDLSEEEKAGLRVLQQTTRSNPLEYYLEKNQEYEFKLLDKASNITYKNVKVDYIENNTKVLASDMTYSTTMPTNKDVIATIKTYVISEKGKECAKVTNNNGSEMYTFTKNGEFTFEYADCAEDQANPNKEVKTHTAKVNWIDKDKPTAEVKYSSKEATDKVIVTLANESEPITIINNGGLKEYTFTKNGEFTFEFQDKAGNKNTAKATVDWLGNDVIFKSDVYKIDKEYVSRITPKTTVSKFKENIKTNRELTFLDKNGKKLGENDIISTDAKVKVGNTTYVLCVIGDIDGNGEVTPTDLAEAIKASLGENNLNTLQKLAVDINEDHEITPTDLAELIQLTLE